MTRNRFGEPKINSEVPIPGVRHFLVEALEERRGHDMVPVDTSCILERPVMLGCRCE